MRNYFDEQLERLHVELIQMGAICEDAIAAASEALLKDDAALAGAAALALDSRLWPKVEDTARSCAYIELSGQPDFTQAFTGNMGV